MSADDVTAASRTSRRKVVVIGAGFAGMAVVRALRDSDAEVTLVDRNNHHLFQPFLFQVATFLKCSPPKSGDRGVTQYNEN